MRQNDLEELKNQALNILNNVLKNIEKMLNSDRVTTNDKQWVKNFQIMVIDYIDEIKNGSRNDKNMENLCKAIISTYATGTSYKVEV